jgi:large subunit ribosomal protein L1
MDSKDIAENIEAIIKRIETLLERGRMNIRSIHIKSTMGPSEKIL